MDFNDPNEAFEHAIRINILSADSKDDNYAGNYMYMHSDKVTDFFKNINTRKYIEVRRIMK